MNENTSIKYERIESQFSKIHEEFNENNTDETNDPPALCISKPFLDETKLNLKIGFPVIITNVFQYALTIETTAFCGRLTSTELEGVALAMSLIGALAWCICSGMVSACDTMFAQSFGSINKKRTGLFLQRGLLLTNLVPVFLWALHINLEPIMILCGQNHVISRIAGEFLIYFTPGITFMMNYLLLARYMQDQGCLWPPVIAGICGNIFNICCQLLFVNQLNLGYKAAALCHALSFGVMTLFEAIYIWKSKFYVETWPGFQLEALYDWSSMFKLGMFGIGQVAFEVFIWESSVLMGGMIGTVEVAVQSIIIQILYMSFMLYYGSGIASNIRVGQCLGANRPNQAKLAYRAGLFVTAVFTIILASLIIILRNQIPFVFTNKKDVLELTIDVIPYVSIILFSDPFSGVCSATLRGCGRQFTGCIIIFISFYILSLPISIILAFVYNMSIKGIWIGPTVGSVVSVSVIGILLECQDWNHQANLAQQRIFASSVIKGNDENKNLISLSEKNEQREKKFLLHIRTPSHPVTCSTEVVDLPKPRMDMNKYIIWKRLGIAGCVFLFLIFGIFLHVFLPTKLYRRVNSTGILE